MLLWQNNNDLTGFPSNQGFPIIRGFSCVACGFSLVHFNQLHGFLKLRVHILLHILSPTLSCEREVI